MATHSTPNAVAKRRARTILRLQRELQEALGRLDRRAGLERQALIDRHRREIAELKAFYGE